MNTYLIRYWTPGQYQYRYQYVVKSENMEKALADEKAKVGNPAAFSWCIDKEQIEGQFKGL